MLKAEQKNEHQLNIARYDVNVVLLTVGYKKRERWLASVTGQYIFDLNPLTNYKKEKSGWHQLLVNI